MRAAFDQFAIKYTKGTFPGIPTIVRIGYARANRDDSEMKEQLFHLQGCDSIHTDYETLASGRISDTLMKCIEELNPGDELRVTRIERLACTLADLTDVLTGLDQQGAHLQIGDWWPAPDIPPGALAAIIQRLIDFESAHRSEQTQIGVAAARAEGRIGGRRHKLKAEQIKQLQAAMAEPGADPVAVGQRFGVGRATVYKYLRMVVE